MKQAFRNNIILLPAALLLSFILLFFGYLRPEYDLWLHTENVVGEGLVTVSLSAPVCFSPFYETQCAFGAEYEALCVPGIHYDVKSLPLVISGIESMEVESFDVYFHGLRIGHYEPEERFTADREFPGMKLSLSADGERVRFDFDDPDAGTTVGVNTHFPPGWFWFAYTAAVLALAFVLFAIFCFLADRVPALRLPILDAGGIFLALLAGCFFCGSLPYVNYTDFLLNWLFFFALALVIDALTLPFVGTLATMVFAAVWYIANYYVIIFRNKPIMPADLKAIGTAAEVMGGYNFTPSWRVVVGVILVLAYGAAVVLVWKRSRPTEKPPVKRQLLRRGITVAVAALLMVAGVNTRAFKSLDSFAWDAVLLKSFHEEGMVLTYLKSALNSAVKRPEGYSREAVDGYLLDYEAESTEGVRPTNIIMVMNEAFSDLRTVGLDGRIDVMPFIDSLDENVVEGSLYVSVFGGGTCNTEFEALTGNTLAFLGTGAYPYTENVTDQLFSLASYFRDMGYLSEAFHANLAQNWNRNKVYPNLGFSEFHDISDYAEALGTIPTLHKQPADAADYAYIETVSEENSGTPRFLFNVTMQNHAGYERWEDVERDESVMEYGSELYLDAQVYLSLVRASDEAVRQLVETYRDSGEPTMIVYFGDHQPGLPAYAQGGIYNDVDSFLDFYKSKFFIWTNYEIETAHDVEISANYLPWLILELGNFPQPPYVRMLREVHEAYPVVSAMGVTDAAGTLYDSVNDLPDDLLIQKYRHIQYANLFDELDPAWFAAR